MIHVDLSRNECDIIFSAQMYEITHLAEEYICSDRSCITYMCVSRPTCQLKRCIINFASFTIERKKIAKETGSHKTYECGTLKHGLKVRLLAIRGVPKIFFQKYIAFTAFILVYAKRILRSNDIHY